MEEKLEDFKSGKNYLNYCSFIESVKRGERSIVFGMNYVVLSREAYDKMINTNFPEITPISYDGDQMHSWIKERFLNPKK